MGQDKISDVATIIPSIPTRECENADREFVGCRFVWETEILTGFVTQQIRIIFTLGNYAQPLQPQAP